MARGSSKLVGILPDALGNDLDAADGVDHDQRGFDGGQRHLGFVDEHVEAGRVDEVDLGFAPLHHGGGGGERHAARDFFFVVIGDGGAFVHAAQALGGAGGEQHGGYERGFARVRVPDQGDVADVCAFVSSSRKTPWIADSSGRHGDRQMSLHALLIATSSGTPHSQRRLFPGSTWARADADADEAQVTHAVQSRTVQAIKGGAPCRPAHGEAVTNSEMLAYAAFAASITQVTVQHEARPELLGVRSQFKALDRPLRSWGR